MVTSVALCVPSAGNEVILALAAFLTCNVAQLKSRPNVHVRQTCLRRDIKVDRFSPFSVFADPSDFQLGTPIPPPPPWLTWKSDHHDGILVKPQFPTGHLGVAFRKKRSIKAREMGNFHPAPFCPTPISAGRKSLCAPASCWWIRVVGYAAGYRINSACGCVRMRADACGCVRMGHR